MKLSLVIMAAGMGSRFGGLKQIEPIGPNGEFIIDYSIYDAIKAGFNEVIFIIKKEQYDIFRDTVGKRVEQAITVKYAFQDNFDIPLNINLNERIKPLGTGHAIYAVRKIVKNPFVVINSDDFYGKDAFIKIASYIRNNENHYTLVGYRVINTLSDNGTVKRGICFEDKGYLKNIIESEIIKQDNYLLAKPLNGKESFNITPDELVSMNMLSFSNEIFPYIEEKLVTFLKESDPLKDEFFLPEIIKSGIKENKFKVKLLNTSAKWLGVTYQEDKELVKKGITDLINKGEYPLNLW